MSHGLRTTFFALLLGGVAVFLSPRWVLRESSRRIAALGRWFSADTPRSRAAAFILIWLIALVPMLHVTWLVRQYAVEVPTLDDWEMAPLIVDAHTGNLKWADIFAQQQEARTVLPKLIFILSAAGGHWDVRDQMMLSVICSWLTAAGIFILLRRSRLGPVALGVSFGLIALTIFSLGQYELWIFASGFPSFFPALFLVAGLVIGGTDRCPTTAKFILCAVLATASSFTLANGLLAWGLTFPAFLLMHPPPRWRRWLIGWLAVAAFCVAAYFWGYQKPPSLPAFAPAVSWTDYIIFILEFLGGGLAYAGKNRPAFAAGLFGAVQVALFFAALACCLRRRQDRAFIARTIPWFALGLHSIGSAILAALGRVGYGAPYALASRYVTFSLYLTIAVIGLVALLAHENFKSRLTLRSRIWVLAIGGVLVASYLIPFQACAFNSRFFLRALSAKDRLARAAVLFSPAIDTSEVIKKTAYPNDARSVIAGADALDRIRLLRPPLIRTNRIERMPNEIADGKAASGACESITLVEGNLLRVSGWAVLPAKGRPADCVAVAYRRGSDGEWILGAISDSFAMRPEIVKRFRTIEQLWSGWSVTFPHASFPAGASLSFWAVDADEPRLYRLRDEVPITAAQ